MNKSSEKTEVLWEDFLNLAEKHSLYFTIPEFGEHLLMYVSKMLADCAPNAESFINVIQKGIGQGIYWSENEKEIMKKPVNKDIKNRFDSTIISSLQKVVKIIHEDENSVE